MTFGYRSIIGLGIASVAAGSLTTFAVNPLKVAAAQPAISFATPTVMDPIHPVGEPSIVVAPTIGNTNRDNVAFGSGPAGTGTQRSIWDASVDGAQTFRIVEQCPTTPTNQVTSVCTPPSAVTSAPNSSTSPGGGDTTQAFDHTGKTYFADLWALACDRVATSTDNGASASQNAYGCNSPTTVPASRPDGSDRQWLTVYDPALTGVTSTAPDAALGKLIYMEYNNLQVVTNPCSFWVKSTDGLNFSAANSDLANYGCDGFPSVDQTTGVVLEASSNCSTTQAVCLNIGQPDATGNLCFLDDPVAITIGGNAHTCATGGGNSFGNKLITVALQSAVPASANGTGDLFVTSSIDTGRNLHVTWGVSGASLTAAPTAGEYQIWTSVAPAAGGWTNWATPVQISSAPANVNIMPWVQAGGPGRSDSVWYGTNDNTEGPSNTTPGSQTWNVYMTQALWPVNGAGAVTGAAPSIQQVKVTPHPMQQGAICLLGTGCITAQGNRNIADFFTVTTDSTGAAMVMYNDTYNGIIQSPQTCATPQASDHCGAAIVTIARQATGPSLFTNGTGVVGGNVPACTQTVFCTPAPPQTGMTDATGDAYYPVIKSAANGAVNQPAFDLTDQSMALSGGNLTATFHVADLTPATVVTDMGNVNGTAFMQYVMRWQMGAQTYYAMMETDGALRNAGADQFYAGTTQSVDLCSVSACDPHVLVYPEAGPGANSVSGTISPPVSSGQPWTVSITVPVADIGSPTNSSLLEEVGTYAFASAHLQASLTTAQAQNDNVPLEVDGVCCFNFQATSSVVTPEVPWTPALLGLGVALIGVGVWRRQRSVGARRTDMSQ